MLPDPFLCADGGRVSRLCQILLSPINQTTCVVNCSFPFKIVIILGIASSYNMVVLFRMSAVVMFFLEVTVLGVCVDKLSFLLRVTKYVKNWMRAALYIV